MTIHKAQGRTIDKVVIDLHYQADPSKRIEFDGVFVALSRVRSRHNLRLLRHPDSTFEQAYSYITTLKPSEQVMAFYNGYAVDTTSPQDGQKWYYEKALTTPITIP